MLMTAKFFPKEDRMRLVLDPDGEAPCALWITRRQWLHLLHTLNTLPQFRGSEPTAAIPRRPIGKRFRTTAEDSPEAVCVDAIRARRLVHGLKLVFVTNAQAVSINLGGKGLSKFRQMLLNHAESAHWDVAAGLARLEAQAVLQAAARRARNNS